MIHLGNSVLQNNCINTNKLARLAKNAGAKLYIDMRKATGSSKPINSPLTTPIKDLSGATDYSFYFNELNYTQETWNEWEKYSAVLHYDGIELTSSTAGYARIVLPTNAKVSTKYGILYEVVSSSIATVSFRSSDYGLVSAILPYSVGYQKSTLTTQATLNPNQLYLFLNNTADGQKIKLRGIKLFELPVGSRIEADFNTLTAEQLNIKYPMAPKYSIKSMLNYTPSNWVEWVKANGSYGNTTGLKLIALNGSYITNYIMTAIKPSTKYGILYNVVECSLSSIYNIEANQVFNSITLQKTIGFNKAVAVSLATIANNKLTITLSALNLTNEYVKLKDIRVFELPASSEIEADFTNLTAAQLNAKYPMSVGKQTITYGNDAFATNMAGTTASGYTEETFVVSTGGENRIFNNLVSNGDFAIDSNSDGLADGWTKRYGTELCVIENGMQKVTKKTTTSAVTGVIISAQPEWFVINHKYFIIGTVKLDSSTQWTGNLAVTVGNRSAQVTVALNTLTVVRAIITPTGWDAIKIEPSTNLATDVDCSIWYDNIMVFDLTTIFGAGNEPTELNNFNKLGYFTTKTVQTKKLPVVVLDGTDDYFNLIDSSNLDITSAPFAVFATVKLTTNAGVGVIVGKNSTGASDIQYSLIYHNAGYFYSYLETNAHIFQTNAGSAAVEIWYSVGLIWDGTDVKMYINGIQSGVTGSLSGSLTSRANIAIGRMAASTYFKGKVASITVYSGELATEANILAAEAAIAKDYIGGGITFTPYYTKGVENVAWVEGYSLGTGAVSKEIDHLSIGVNSTVGLASRTYVTDIAVDLTNISTLYIDWENTGDSSNYNKSVLIASTSKALNWDSYNARLLFQQPFTRKVDSLDVSALSGSYYIRVHAPENDNTNTITTNVNVYRIWGE